MLTKAGILSKYVDIHDGMTVRSQDGEKLGKVVEMSEDCFTIEKGFFFPKDFTARYDDIVDLREGDVILNQSLSDLNNWRNETYEGWNEYERNNLITAETPQQEIRVPVTEERLEAQKTLRQAGEVRLRKVVHTELKNITVPVMKEEVVIERTPVVEPRAASSREANFEQETVSMPVMEEEVEIRKRPVVKEEVRLKKETRVEEQTVSDEVRSEDVEIEGEDKLKRRKAG